VVDPLVGAAVVDELGTVGVVVVVDEVVVVDSATLVVGDSMEPAGASTLRLLSSPEPPQAATTRREDKTRHSRFGFTPETLFKFACDALSGHANHY
jgi:hypothetical protein